MAVAAAKSCSPPLLLRFNEGAITLHVFAGAPNGVLCRAGCYFLQSCRRSSLDPSGFSCCLLLLTIISF